MKLPLFAACLVAGSTWSFAFADQTTTTNPKTALKAFNGQRATHSIFESALQEDEALNLARKLAARSQGSSQAMQGGGGAQPASPSTTGGTLAVLGGDDCSAAEVITGTGTFGYDCTNATTGSPTFPCATGGTDVWFSWVAPVTGSCTFSLCPASALDSVIAAWSGGPGCPAGNPLACNDDTCGLRSRVAFPVTAGSNYMLQIGGFAGDNMGVGTFTLSIAIPPPPPPPCALDDGLTETGVGWSTGGDLVWLNAYGTVGVPWTITSIQATWGSLVMPGTIANGTPSDVFIYSDPNQDGSPLDAALLVQVPTTVQGAYTDTPVDIPLTTPITVMGRFFVGCHLIHSSGQRPLPLDTTAPTTNPTWTFGANATPTSVANYANPAANSVPLSNLGTHGFPGEAMLRVPCSSGPATYLCMPGVGGVVACPCGNPPSGAGVRGCNNSDATGGASILATGTATLSADTLVLTTNGQGNVTSLVWQGTSDTTPGVASGQGVRCVGGNLLRLYGSGGGLTGSGFSITVPPPGNPSISAKSALLGDTLAPGVIRYYFVAYRDPTVLGGCPSNATYNYSSAAAVVWN